MLLPLKAASVKIKSFEMRWNMLERQGISSQSCHVLKFNSSIYNENVCHNFSVRFAGCFNMTVLMNFVLTLMGAAAHRSSVRLSVPL